MMWKDIPGYGGVYQASTEGQIRRVLKDGKTKLLSPYCHKVGENRRYAIGLVGPDGKRHERTIIRILAETFLGPCPDGCVAYHVNGLQSDNSLGNIKYISKVEFGVRTGASANRRPVVKLDADGNPVAFYSSARAAGRANYISYQSILNRCNGKAKRPLYMDGHGYKWDDTGYWKRGKKNG